MQFLRPGRLRRSITAVVFTCPADQLDRFDVAFGPCVPRSTGGESLVDPVMQDGGETPALTASLFTALTGQQARDVLTLVDRSGKGRLSRFSEEFVDAMADSCEVSLRLADEDEARGRHGLPSFGRHQEELSSAWMRAGRWPREVIGLQNRLVRTGAAREARLKQQHLFGWHGPSVPVHQIVSGRGPYPG